MPNLIRPTAGARPLRESRARSKPRAEEIPGNECMATDKDTARRVAHLARIEVAETDLDPLAAELSAILGFMEQLAEVDVAGVEPMTSVTPMKLKWRVDEVTAGGQRDAVLANAPDARSGFFAVPKVVE